MRGDVTEVYKILKAMDKLNAELLFTQPQNMRTVKCSMTPVQKCFKADIKESNFGDENTRLDGPLV